MRMYHIAICDDEQPFVDWMWQQVEAVTGELRIPCEVSCFTETGALYDALCDKDIEINLVLLDILMDEGEGGMRLAARLRECGDRTGIVLVSSSADYLRQGYDVQAMKYLLKPVEPAELKAAILYDYRNHFKKQHLCLEMGAGIHALPLSEIDCFEISGKRIAAHLHGNTYYYRGKIADLEALLPPEFFRCHASFLVNLDNVVHIGRYVARMGHGREVPVSQRLFKDTQEVYLKCLETKHTIFQKSE